MPPVSGDESMSVLSIPENHTSREMKSESSRSPKFATEGPFAHGSRQSHRPSDTHRSWKIHRRMKRNNKKREEANRMSEQSPPPSLSLSLGGSADQQPNPEQIFSLLSGQRETNHEDSADEKSYREWRNKFVILYL